MFRFLWIFLFGLILLSFVDLLAQDCPDTRLLAVSRGNMPASTSEPDILSDGEGGFWMIFRIRNYEDNWSRLRIQKVDALGKTQFREPGLEISTLPGEQSQHAAIAYPGFLSIVWRQAPDAVSPGDIYFQTISDQGHKMLNEKGLPVCIAPGNQLSPRLLNKRPEEEIYLVWEDEREGENLPKVYIQKFTSAQSLHWQDNGTLVANTDFPQKRPVLCEDSRGGVYVAWEDYRSRTGWQLWFQSFTPEGTPRYGPTGSQLLRSDASSQGQAMIAPDGFGGFIFACQKMDVVNFEMDIYYGRINHSGQRVYQYPACSAFGEQRNPLLIVRTTEVLLTWEDKRNPSWDIYGQYISLRDGSVQWEFNGLPLADGDAEQLHAGLISSLEFNDMMMVWQDEEDIHAQKLNVFGERLWQPQGIQVCSESGRQIHPRICRNGSGGCWISWTDYREGVKVYFQHLNREGLFLQKAQGSTFIQDPEALNGTGIESLSVLITHQDSMWVLWEDYRKGTNDPDIYITKCHNDGQSLFVENGLPVCTEIGEQTRPVMVPDLEGGVWVVWIDRRNDRDEDIYYQHLSPGGFPYFPITGRVLVSAPRSQAQLQVRADGKGGFWAAWTDAREFKTQGFDVFVQRVLSDGNVFFEPGGLRISEGNHDSHTPVLAPGSEGEVGLLFMDNMDKQFNLLFQVLTPNGSALFSAGPIAVSPSIAHQRYPALIQWEDAWVMAWSEEYAGQGNDRILIKRIHRSGQTLSPEQPIRISTGSGRQLRPQFSPYADSALLISWQEDTGVPDEGVVLRCKALDVSNLQSFREEGRFVARLSDEKEGLHVAWHVAAQKSLLAWTEKKTYRKAAWTTQPSIRPSIPDAYNKGCDSRFEQRNVRVLPLNEAQEFMLIWSEIRDANERIYCRRIALE
jgi:hypothetical protein